MLTACDNTMPVSKQTYTVKEVSAILNYPLRSTYDFVGKTKHFRVLRMGKSVRIEKTSFDKWFYGC